MYNFNLICLNLYIYKLIFLYNDFILNKMGEKTEVKSLWSKYFGLHTCYKSKNKELRLSNFKQISKNYLSSDCFLKFENMKSKSLVIVN